MRFESTLVSSWSRREWLSVAVVAVTTAFLIGSVVLLLTVGSYVSTLEGDLGSSATVSYDDSYDDAVAAADASDAEEIVFPVTTVRTGDGGDGESQVVVGVPPDAPPRIESASVAWNPASVPAAPESGFTGPVEGPTERRLGDTAVQLTPHPDERTIFPAEWYVGSAEAVTSLDDAGALVIDTGESASASASTADRQAAWRYEGAPLIAALPFLVGGLGQVVRTLSVAAVGGGLLVVVVVYSVTRMSIRDRHPELRVARATGISPTRLFAVLLLRVLGLTGTGVLLGFALGLIAVKAVINAATYAGFVVSIQAVVTASILQAILLVGGFLVGMGLLAGVLATLPVVRGDPMAIGRDARGGRYSGHGGVGDEPNSLVGRLRAFVADAGPTFVDWRAAVPTTTTLTVFMLVLLLVTAIGGAIAPLATTESGTVTEAGSVHPLNSRISEEYATVLRDEGIAASPEVLYAQTTDGDPYLVRGANFTAFGQVTDARLVAGHAPRAYDQAVVGASLAKTLDVEVGETLTLGGSVTPGVRRVTVVGRFSGSGITDDQLVLPLDTAQTLATGDGQVHLIRTNGTAEEFERLSQRPGGLAVTSLAGNDSVQVGDPYAVTVAVRNYGEEATTRNVTVSAGDRSRRESFSLAPDEAASADVTFTFSESGTYTIRADGTTKRVEVYDPRTLQLPDGYPTRAPPGSTLVVPATTPNGTLVSGATVTLGDRTRQTRASGGAIVPVPDEPGEYTLTVEKEGYASERHALVVEEGAPQRLSGRVDVSPESGTQLTRPTVTVQVGNPWGRLLVRNVSLVTPGGTERRTVRLGGGEVQQITVPASDAGLNGTLAPGTYDLRVVSDGAVLATTTYEVTGDERVSSTVDFEGEYSQGSGIGRAVEGVFGNVRVLFLVMLVLAGASTVGGTAATFAHAVHANRRRIGIYRATGASRRQLLAALVRDAVTLALPATVIAFAAAFACLRALSWADVLVVFGIRLDVPLSAWLFVGSGLGAMLLAVGSALGVGYVFLVADPDRLLRAEM
ncbi:ABC transporter permease [Halogeometricum sp. S1BR25-6]|uniref:ABC transporter permease n=1 Tax=Halogeometricum salsisoli TaxID=2950536 RepID=A0ABU2GIP6_9EURY|nr:FtsX-like permease family protein [Halogeometricum sp. S1BR25-6]MDS0300133.1 ABC transporter permease [Halogeometricum sp. S1BR25-6]